jgi:hypothetical protein
LSGAVLRRLRQVRARRSARSTSTPWLLTLCERPGAGREKMDRHMAGGTSPLRLLLFAVLFAAIFVAGRYLGAMRETQEEDKGAISLALEREADELNATLPEQVSENVRLDKATTGPGNAFTYVYTVVDDAAAQDFRRNYVELNKLKQQLKERVCTMMPEYRNRGTVVGYSLRDNSGKSIAEISVDPRECS